MLKQWLIPFMLLLTCSSSRIHCNDRVDIGHSFETEFKTCRKSTITSNRSQSDFVSIRDFENAVEQGNEMRFDVFIRGSASAWIQLAEANDYNPNKPSYEIEIGSNDNSRTRIVRYQQGEGYGVLEGNDTPYILKPDQIQRFTIQIKKGGHIRIFREADDTPLVTAHDQNPLKINYFRAYTVGYNTPPIEFLYDCRTTFAAPTESTNTGGAVSKFFVEFLTTFVGPITSLVNKA